MPAFNSPVGTPATGLTVSQAVPFVVPDGGGTADPNSLLGWAITEHTGSAPASFRIWDNPTAASGVVLVPLVTLPAGGSSIFLADDEGMQIYTTGLWLQIVSGSIEANIYWSK